MYVELQKLTADERGRAAADMARDRVKKAAQADVLDEDIDQRQGQGSSERLARRQVVLRAEVLMLDLGMYVGVSRIAVAEPPATLLPRRGRRGLRTRSRYRARAPSQSHRPGRGRGAVAFVEHIPGEPKDVRREDPDGHADDLVAGITPRWSPEKGRPACRSRPDPQARRIDSIANAAKEATDRVFGAYKLGSAFRSDRPPPIGRGELQLFADTESQLAAMSPAAKRGMAKDWSCTSSSRMRRSSASMASTTPIQKFDAAGLPLNTKRPYSIPSPMMGQQRATRDGVLNDIDEARAPRRSDDARSEHPDLQEDRRPPRIAGLVGYVPDPHSRYIHTLAHPDYVRFAEGFRPSQEIT